MFLRRSFNPSSPLISNLSTFCKLRMVVKEEVRNALATNQPVVALESTIITHGMPFPKNTECAYEVEATVREQVGNYFIYFNMYTNFHAISYM